MPPKPQTKMTTQQITNEHSSDFNQDSDKSRNRKRGRRGRGHGGEQHAPSKGVSEMKEVPKLVDNIAEEDKTRARDTNLNTTLEKRYELDRQHTSILPPPLSTVSFIGAQATRAKKHPLNSNEESSKTRPLNLPPSSEAGSTDQDNRRSIEEASHKADIVIRAWENMYAATHRTKDKLAYVDAALKNIENGYEPYTDRQTVRSVVVYGTGNESDDEVGSLPNPYSPKLGASALPT